MTVLNAPVLSLHVVWERFYTFLSHFLPPPPTEQYNEANLTGFIASINRRLKPLGLEIASSQMEDSAALWYGLVNRSEDPAATVASTYSPAELAFFNKIVSYSM